MTTATPVARTRLAPPSDASTIKPILRKPSSVLGVRRRSDDGEEEDDIQLRSSPTKKRKTVMFNESLNVVKNIGSKSIDDTKREVRQTLEDHAKGDNLGYNHLEDVFEPHSKKCMRRKTAEVVDDEGDVGKRRKRKEDEVDHQEILLYVIALTDLAPLLGKTCSGLVESILNCSWLERDDKFVRAYIQLLAAISSAQGSYFVQVLSMMVNKFTPTRSPSVVVPGFPSVDIETRKQRLHLGLRYLLDLFPAGSQLIVNLVTSKFPYTEESKAVHIEYVDNLLRLKDERPDIEREIMELLLSRLVQLDVEMTLDLENDDDETTQAVMEELESADAKGGDGESDDGAASVPEFEDDERMRRVLMIKSKLETLDAILDLLFSVYDPIFDDPDSPAAKEAFENLLSDFSNVILPHIKSRHTQYLLFKFAMKSQSLTDVFVGTLFSIASDPERSPVVKQAAVAYLASFTARGAQVETEQVQGITKTLLGYMDHYRAEHANCRGPNIERYEQYYTYFQGLLYIFCFRWRDLIDRELAPESLDWDDPASFIGQDLPWMPWLRPRLQANIASKFNPLKCCSPVIVEEFARLAHHLRLLYIYPQIEKNKFVGIAMTLSYGGSHNTDETAGALRDCGEQRTHLEACFPFDPFQLPVAKRWLDLPNTYMSWQSFAVLEGKEEAETDDGEINDDKDTEDNVSVDEDTATEDEDNYE